MNEKSKRERASEAWEGCIGEQGVADFLQISREKGFATPAVAVADYVEWLRTSGPDGHGVDDLPEDIEALLLHHIAACA